MQSYFLQDRALARLVYPEEHRAMYDRIDHQVSYMPTRQPFSGIGFGLSLSRIFIEYLGGSLKVLSRPGEGTTAAITLPVTMADPGAHAEVDPEEAIPRRGEV